MTDSPHLEWRSPFLRKMVLAAVNSGRLFSSERPRKAILEQQKNKNKSKPIGDAVGCQAFAFRNELYPNHRQPLNTK